MISQYPCKEGRKQRRLGNLLKSHRQRVKNKGPDTAVQFRFPPLAIQILAHGVLRAQSKASLRGVRGFASRYTASWGSIGTGTKVLNPDQHLLPVTASQPQKQLCLCRGRDAHLLSVLQGYDPVAYKPGFPPAMAWLAQATPPPPRHPVS